MSQRTLTIRREGANNAVDPFQAGAPAETDTQDRDLLAQQLLARVREEAEGRRLPEATYRLQFHADFGFRDAVAILPYLHDLGITDCYASPYLKARPGSRHGYDITDHGRLNPEVNKQDDYAEWLNTLKRLHMGQVLDIVPNHMAVVGNENNWWNDVLENGPASPYANYFDIAWSSSPRPELQGRVLIPILGDTYAKVLEAQQLRLEYADGAFGVHYFEHRFPIAPRSYGLILKQGEPELEAVLGTDTAEAAEYQSILTAIKHLPRSNELDPARLAERRREKEVVKRRLAELTSKSGDARNLIERIVARFNGAAGVPSSFNLLEELLDDQLYRLAYWRVAADEINYRRFFDINELAALSMEREEVFTATHRLLLDLLENGEVTGLRIDHPDGLYNPREYLERLQAEFVVRRARTFFENMPEREAQAWPEVEVALRQAWDWARNRINVDRAKDATDRVTFPATVAERWPLFVVVEKILTGTERLPTDWPTFGTSGYDFLNLINGLFVASENREAFALIYSGFIHDDTPLSEVIFRKKKLILQIALSGELQMLSHQLDRLAQKNRRSRDFTLHSLRQALREIIASFPVYRSYITDDKITDADRKYVLLAVRRAMLANPALSTGMFHFVRDMLMLRGLGPEPDDAQYREEQRRFVGKFQQVTAPVMAKGVEDTSFYVYNRLISLNEVGGDPDRFGIPPSEVHAALAERQSRWPWAFSASSTHDTKRSEDVRARLNVLSELPQEWQICLERWTKLNAGFRSTVDEALAPDANEEYFLYQTLLGAWPIEPCAPGDFAAFIERIQAYMHKAMQEAKVHTSWINPNSAYDDAVQQFVSVILDQNKNAHFLEDFRAFQKQISDLGMVNSLAQTLVKVGAPGVADFYQGSELWDFSLVDPDNRRAVDYERRRQLLADLNASVLECGNDRRPLARELASNMADGRIKLYVTSKGLECRRETPALFTHGSYLALEAAGAHSKHVFGFLRSNASRHVLVVVPRLIAGLGGAPLPCGSDIWRDTTIKLPTDVAKSEWQNLFTGQVLARHLQEDGACLPIADLLADFPVALLSAQGT
jgi:(1->4)-alpha-D-glucan 1-alpha-D-glucosylmutase